jgi:hypothetical protein
VVQADRTPPLPPEDRRSVDQHDALEIGLGAGVEERVGAGEQQSDRVVGIEPGDGGGHPRRDLGLDLVEHGREQIGLVDELGVERATRDPGLARDAPGADRGIAVLGEEPTGHGHERAARRRGPLDLGAARGGG